MENVINVTDHFWIIDEGGVRSFLFEGSEKAMLVDTGFGSLPIRDIAEGLTDKDIFLVNTHTDRDHTGGNASFDSVLMHPAEMDHYKNALPDGCDMKGVLPLWDGSVIDLGYWKFEVILTPGHTPGSIMLLERGKKMLVSGDTVQDGNIFMFGEGRNMQAFKCSLKKIISLSESFETVWPSHGSCPISADVVPKILRGAEDMLAGKIAGTKPSGDMPCERYAFDAAAFLYRQ